MKYLFWRFLARAASRTPPFTRCFKLRASFLHKQGIAIKNDVSVAGGCRILGRGQMTIGEGTWLGPYGLYFTHPDALIYIGARCLHLRASQSQDFGYFGPGQGLLNGADRFSLCFVSVN